MTISVASGQITSVLDPVVTGSPLVDEFHLTADSTDSTDSTGRYLLLSQGQRIDARMDPGRLDAAGSVITKQPNGG